MRTKPDILLYHPTGKYDGDNEHLIVFETASGKELLALWTQSSLEGQGDNRLMLARSTDGEKWGTPVRIAGARPGSGDFQASWGWPVVVKTGRIYVFYTREMEEVDLHRQGCGTLGCIYSDDDGHNWIAGVNIPMARTPYDHPNPRVPRNWIAWQKPIHDSQGRWFNPYGCCTSPEIVKKKYPHWIYVEVRSYFLRFENLDLAPAPEDIKITWLPKDSVGLEVPQPMYPELVFAGEPSVVLLPDGRLFCIVRTFTGFLWYCVSADDGLSWTALKPLRYCDEGGLINQPLAPSPIYSLADGRYILLYHNNPGTKGVHSQYNVDWGDVNHLNYIRNPAYLALGEFRPDAEQPVWFSQPVVFVDTDDVVYGPKQTAEAATYPSLTEHKGKRVLWYPDRKHFLLGKYIADETLEKLHVPA